MLLNEDVRNSQKGVERSYICSIISLALSASTLRNSQKGVERRELPTPLHLTKFLGGKLPKGSRKYCCYIPRHIRILIKFAETPKRE